MGVGILKIKLRLTLDITIVSGHIKKVYFASENIHRENCEEIIRNLLLQNASDAPQCLNLFKPRHCKTIHVPNSIVCSKAKLNTTYFRLIDFFTV